MSLLYMSQKCRIEASKLQKRYAFWFNLTLEEVTIRELPDDEAEVFAVSRPDLPVWSTGSLP